jgi:hypothetical protein
MYSGSACGWPQFQRAIRSGLRRGTPRLLAVRVPTPPTLEWRCFAG